MDKTELGVVKKLERLCDDFLAGKKKAEDFADKFEELFNSGDVPRDVYKQLEDILDAVSYYEPRPEIREHETFCLDEDQLRAVVQRTLTQYREQNQ
jgi:hypothetical protein